ncbi:MAG: GDP-mannose 4,6-dehydratase [Candidatus Omnitrophica bacterium]|nr:GDP-mannose 4,6-dehydratase [Candidatus Omnitrophota bacterium]
MAKTLVTGGAGFIGSHLSEALLKNGDKVTVVDDLSTGRLNNISRFRSNNRFSFYEDTILNKRLMKRLIKDCDIIYHLAAAVGVKYIIEHPIDSIKTNIKGTDVVLGMACEFGNKKVILASTSEIYGKDRPGKHVFSEEDDRLLGSTTRSRWSYSCAKAIDEFLALAYRREKRLPVIICRFFNTCGPRQTGRYGMVVPRFIRQALSGEPITIYGDGKQTRCFGDVSDAVRAVLLLSKNPKAYGRVFNIGNPENKVTINALAKKIRSMTHSASAIKHIPYAKAYREGFEDMRHREPDISRLKSVTGFKPNIGIDDMLLNIIKGFKSDD